VFTLQAVLVSHHSSAFFLVSKTLQKYSKVYHGPTEVDHRIGELLFQADFSLLFVLLTVHSFYKQLHLNGAALMMRKPCRRAFFFFNGSLFLLLLGVFVFVSIG
jgi:hypothetical protein